MGGNNFFHLHATKLFSQYCYQLEFCFHSMKSIIILWFHLITPNHKRRVELHSVCIIVFQNLPHTINPPKYHTRICSWYFSMNIQNETQVSVCHYLCHHTSSNILHPLWWHPLPKQVGKNQDDSPTNWQSFEIFLPICNNGIKVNFFSKSNSTKTFDSHTELYWDEI